MYIKFQYHLQMLFCVNAAQTAVSRPKRIYNNVNRGCKPKHKELWFPDPSIEINTVLVFLIVIIINSNVFDME